MTAWDSREEAYEILKNILFMNFVINNNWRHLS